jgi:hypothetical protein
VRIGRNDRVRKAWAAALYVVGVACVLFVVYQDRLVPNSILRYWPLFVIGMVSVAAAALLWPVRGQAEDGTSSAEEHEEEQGDSESPFGKAEG